MDDSPQSQVPEFEETSPIIFESENDDNFTDQGDLNSSDLQVDDYDRETSSQMTPSSDEFNQKLIDLSALIPSSNEIDEVSVISKTIEYLKELRETIALLEAKEDEAVSSNRQSEVSSEKDISDISSNSKIEENSGREIGTSSAILTEIVARFLNKDILIRIHCMKSRGLVVKILSHLKDLHLSVIRNSVLRFGDSHFEISIVTQMTDGFTMTEKELIRSLRMTVFPSI